MVTQLPQNVERLDGRHVIEVRLTQLADDGVLEVLRKEPHLPARGSRGCGRLVRLGVDGERLQELGRPPDRRGGDAGDLGDVDAVAAIGPARQDAIKKNDLLTPLPDRDVKVRDVGRLLGECRQLVIVGGKERPAASLGERFGDCPRQREPVERARPPPDLVEYDDAPLGRVMKNVGRLVHLHHEGRSARVQLVRGPDACEDPVDDADARLARGHVRADLGQQHDQRNVRKL